MKMNEGTKITLTVKQLRNLVREGRKMVSERWHMVSKNLKTGEFKPHGEYPSRKAGVDYAPDVLDGRLKELAGCVDIDRRDELIGDFMAANGKKAIRYGDYVFFLAPNVFDAWGKIKSEPEVPDTVG